MTRKEFLLKIIKIRKALIKKHNSKKNYLKCIKIINKLEIQISAYQNKWNEEGWKNFLKRNYDEIVFILPGNKSFDNQLETLKSLII